jgi:hypothetical protein
MDRQYGREAVTWPLFKGLSGALIGWGVAWLVHRLLSDPWQWASAPAMAGLFALMGVIDGLGDARARWYAREADRAGRPNPGDNPSEYSWALWSVDRPYPPVG